MSGNVPKEVKERIQVLIWSKADELAWPRLSDLEHARWYENWAKDSEIGGVLAHFMDPRRVRVYIKDSLLKPYQRNRLHEGWERVSSALDLGPASPTTADRFAKPHGRILIDGRVVCWGNSRDWKTILFSVFERAYRSSSRSAYAAVFIETGRTNEDSLREMVRDASDRLGIARAIWLD